ncbi:MAG: S49 family peptidase [Geminicoccaceae bacterium]
MGNAAASGGYWIAMGASHIVAEPATLTGSIGVIAGKPVLAGLWEQLGVHWATLQRGQNAAYLSLNQPFDALARERLDRAVDALYERFKAGVAAGRGLPPDAVEALAQRRVWLGGEAQWARAGRRAGRHPRGARRRHACSSSRPAASRTCSATRSRPRPSSGCASSSASRRCPASRP